MAELSAAAPSPGRAVLRMVGAAGPVVAVLIGIVAIWFLAVAPMNMRLALDGAERAGEVVVPETPRARQEVSVWRLMAQNRDLVGLSYTQDRPRLPTPGQVAGEFWASTGAMALEGRAMSRRSLIFHGWITLQSTFWGFLLGTTLGIAGAIGIVYSDVLRLSLMPWAIISQTIPIVALAPMIIVLSAQLGIDGRGVPKAVISALLVLFPGAGGHGEGAALARRLAA